MTANKSKTMAVAMKFLAGDTAWAPRCSAGRTAESAGPRRRNAQLRWAMRGQDPLKEQRVPPPMAEEGGRVGFHTGHDSSFHAISQNIHSYRELLMNACSRRTFSPSVACFAHISTFPRIHSPTSANSGDA